MKRDTRQSRYPFVAVVTLAAAVLHGAYAQEVIKDPVLEFGYSRLQEIQACPGGNQFVAVTWGERWGAPPRLFLFSF